MFFGRNFTTGLLIGCVIAVGVAAAAITYERYDTKTLKRTMRRDAVYCGVNTGLPGFSAQDDKGNWWWVAFAKKGDKETINNKVQFKIKSEAEDKLTLATEGKDQGKKPLKNLPAELVIEVPDEHTVVITDPVRGRLVYKAS